MPRIIGGMQRWQHYSSDPNAPELYLLRRKAITKARTRGLIADRVDYLCRLAAGKSVLDIGVVEHTTSATESPAWLHGNLKRFAAQCLGIDVLEKDVAKLRERGFDVICADITHEPLSKNFDVIIGGEVIEHLDAPGMFMENCSAMLPRGGRLVITTPNPWYASVILKHLFHAAVFVDSADHVAWYDAWTLYELGQRHGLDLERFTGIGCTRPISLKARVFFTLSPLLIHLGLSPELFAKSIVYEFVRR
jgi:SAM-dependent methyltransferase